MPVALAKLLGQLDLNPPAKPAAIARAEKKLKLKLPKDYVEFLLRSNGGEGVIGKEGYLRLERVEALPTMNKGYEVEEFAPGLLLFGSDGGDEAYGFDMRKNPWRIVSIPFIPLDWADAHRMGKTFIEFLRKAAKG